MFQLRKSAMQVAAIGGDTPVAAPLSQADIITMARLGPRSTGEAGPQGIFGRANSSKTIDGHPWPRIMKGIGL